MSQVAPSVRVSAFSATGSVTIPASVVVGDVMVVAVAVGNGGATITLSDSSWAFATSVATPTELTLNTWSKVAVASDPGSTLTATATDSGTSYIPALALLDYENAAGTVTTVATSVDVSALLTSYTAPTVTTSLANSTVLECWAILNNQTITLPATAEGQIGLTPTSSSSPFTIGASDQAQATAGTSATETASVASGTDWNVATLVLSPVQPPYAPTLGSPANASYDDLSGTPTFSWTYNPTPGDGAQSNYAMRMKLSGASSYSYWNASTSAWQSTIVWNLSSVSSVTFPVGAWTDGNTYNWSVATQEATYGLQGPFASDFTVNAQQAPSVSVTAPTGTIDSATPTVTWTPTLASGAVQTAYRVVLYSAAQFSISGFTPGTSPSTWDSGTVAGTATSQVVPAGYLVNQTGYRAYVQITETGSELSAWNYSGFTLSADVPATPSATATATTDPGTGLPGITIAVQCIDNWLSAAQASFEGPSTTGWTAGANTTLGTTSTNPLDGAYAATLTATAAGTISATTPQGTSGFPVTPGQQCRALANFRAQVTGRTCDYTLYWWQSSGAASAVTPSYTVSVTDTTTAYTLASIGLTDGIAPSDAAFCSIGVSIAGCASGEVHQLDECLVAPGLGASGGFADLAWSRGGLTGLTTCAVIRNDGLYVRGASVANPVSVPGQSQTFTVTDYEVVPTVEYTYTAQTSAVLGANATVTSANSASTSATSVTTTGWWEFDPTDVSTAVSAQITQFNPQVTEQSTAHLVMGQSVPNVIANAMGGTDGAATFETFDAPTYNGLQLLLQSQKTIFISNPYGDLHGIDYCRIGPQSGGMSTGMGNKAKSANLHPSTSSAPHHLVQVTWIAQVRPPT